MNPADQLEVDAVVMSQLVAGDHLALSTLYDRYIGMVLAIGMRVLRDRGEAEALAEDVFVEAWRRSGSYDPERGSVATWLATMARSRAIDAVRRRQRQRQREGGEAALEAVTDESLSPVANTVLRDERTRIRACLADLTTEQRQAIELSYFEGLSHIEVATKLSRPLGTVKSHIRQALIRLRESFRTHGEEP